MRETLKQHDIGGYVIDTSCQLLSQDQMYEVTEEEMGNFYDAVEKI
jgi:hypothetical protein